MFQTKLSSRGAGRELVVPDRKQRRWRQCSVISRARAVAAAIRNVQQQHGVLLTNHTRDTLKILLTNVEKSTTPVIGIRAQFYLQTRQRFDICNRPME